MRALNESKHFLNHGLYKVLIDMTKIDNLGVIIFNVSQYNSMFGITIIRQTKSLIILTLVKLVLYSKRIYGANGILRYFFSSHKCFFKT